MRFAFASLILFAGLALMPATAGAKDGQVRVVNSGNQTDAVTISLASLGSPDINNRDYVLASGTERINNGYSLARVLEAAETQAGGWLTLDTLPSVEIDRPSGGKIGLSRAQALDRNFFSDGPPVFYEDNGTTVFVMPGSPGRAYVFRLAAPDVKVGDGLSYDVSLTHSPDRPRKGQAVTIRAAVTGVPSGTSLTYSWRFSDGSRKTTSAPRVVHRFGRAGGRWVAVTVSGGDGSGYDFQQIDVRTDDDGGGGGGEPKEPEPDSGDRGVGGSSSSFGGGAGFGSGTGSFPGSPSVGTPIDALPDRPEPDQPNPSDEGLEEVSGVLIDPAVAGGPASDTAQVEADSTGGGFGLSGEAATLFGVGLLIALGGLIEVRLLSRRI